MTLVTHRRRVLWLSLVVASSVLADAPVQPVPVPLVQSTEIDACPSLLQVSGLNPRGDGFLALRSGPGASYPIVAKLPEGAPLLLCGHSDQAPWVPVIWPDTDDVSRCGVSSPQTQNAHYQGPCRAGWVHRRWLRLVAG